jgi:hypothetical protein
MRNIHRHHHHHHPNETYYRLCYFMVGILISQIMTHWDPHHVDTVLTNSRDSNNATTNDDGITMSPIPASSSSSSTTTTTTPMIITVFDTINEQIIFWIVPLYTVLVLLYLMQQLWCYCHFVFQRQQPHRQQKQPRPAFSSLSSSSSSSSSSQNEQQQRHGSSALSHQAMDMMMSNHNTSSSLLLSTPSSSSPSVAPVNMTGVYKLIANHNFEEFLAAQNIPWALRRAANQARPIHRITHTIRNKNNNNNNNNKINENSEMNNNDNDSDYSQHDTITIKIEGIIESQSTFVIDGPKTETNVRGRIFHDTVRYLHPITEGLGILVTKIGITDNYNCTVQRTFTKDDLSQITMRSTVIFRHDENNDNNNNNNNNNNTGENNLRAPVSCTQIFQRVE